MVGAPLAAAGRAAGPRRAGLALALAGRAEGSWAGRWTETVGGAIDRRRVSVAVVNGAGVTRAGPTIVDSNARSSSGANVELNDRDGRLRVAPAARWRRNPFRKIEGNAFIGGSLSLGIIPGWSVASSASWSASARLLAELAGHPRELGTSGGRPPARGRPGDVVPERGPAFGRQAVERQADQGLGLVEIAAGHLELAEVAAGGVGGDRDGGAGVDPGGVVGGPGVAGGRA